jgi:hypothetical protein
MRLDEEHYFSELSRQPVESLGHWNVSIGGFSVNGLNGPPELHPIVRMGESAVEPLLTRIRQSPSPLREILLLNAITGRESTRLENSIINFEDPPEEFIADERRRVLAEYKREHEGQE